MGKFKLWLEFEEWCDWLEKPDADLYNEYFNMQITLDDGIEYALNVWTFKAVESARLEAQRNNENLNGAYLEVPDLLIEKLDRELIENIVADLIKAEKLKDEWRITRK